MKNKNGFTLVELIVVIALMGIILGAVGLSMNSLGGQKVKTSSRKVYNTLGTAQTVAMSKGNTLFGLVYEDGGYTAYILYSSTSGSSYVVSEASSLSKAVSYSFKCADGTTYTIGDSTADCSGVIISIDRTTGKFDGTYLYSGTITAPVGITLSNCTNLYIGGGDNLKDIVLVSLTGKFYYNE